MDQRIRGRQVELHADHRVRVANIAESSELTAQPLAREGELVMSSRLDEGVEVLEQLLRIKLDVGADEALGAEPFHHRLGITDAGNAHERAHRHREAIRQLCHGPEVENAELALRRDAEVARVRVGMKQACTRRA